MKPVEIKILLLQKGLSVAGLAEKFGCRRQELSMCINRQSYRVYPELREKLARELGVTTEKLFGEQNLNVRKAA